MKMMKRKSEKKTEFIIGRFMEKEDGRNEKKRRKKRRKNILMSYRTESRYEKSCILNKSETEWHKRINKG